MLLEYVVCNGLNIACFQYFDSIMLYIPFRYLLSYLLLRLLISHYRGFFDIRLPLHCSSWNIRILSSFCSVVYLLTTYTLSVIL